jgi:tetratricopeptide (TPR) repeat protein
MDIDILRGELERLFKLEEQQALAKDILGFSLEEVGGTASSATFARALVEHCKANDAVDALADTIVSLRADVDPKLRDASINGFSSHDEIANGAKLGDLSIVKRLGEGPLAHVYLAKRDGKDTTLRVLRHDVAFDRRRVQRYLAHNRQVAGLSQDNLPKGLTAAIVEDRAIVTYEHADAQSLAARVGRLGPIHLNEARTILTQVLEALAAIHEKRLAHGSVKLENVLLARGDAGTQKVILVDAGADRLRRRPRASGDVLGMVVNPKIAAPELHRGKGADPRSDLYAFGVLVYELLSGKPPFAATSPAELASQHLGKQPEPPSTVAPRGWISKEIDAFVLGLLAKDPSARPKDARAVLSAVEALGRAPEKKKESTLTDEQLSARIDKLVESPEDEEAALALESAVEEGGDAVKIADAFAMAADTLDIAEDDEAKETKSEIKKALLFRAARIFDTAAKDAEKAEGIYAAITTLDPHDEIAMIALEEVRKKLGKYDELIEMLLARSERAESREEKARAFAEIGRICAHDTDDKAQALVAYAQALAECPEDDDYAREVERLAGSDPAQWNESLETLVAQTQAEIPPEQRNALFMLLGGWYGKKLSRPDLALPCFQAVVSVEPSNDAALAGMAEIYRTAQQWPELGAVLLRRADVAPNPARARDLRATAAELLLSKLNEPLRAKDVYELIIEEDPAHDAATTALVKIYEQLGETEKLVKVLERQADALRGEQKARALCRIAELFEGQLDNLEEAIHRYEAAIAVDERHLDALKGLDRIFNRTNRYKELLQNLDRQLAIAATPRQKINLYERIASIHDEEFLDHKASATALEAILAIDPAHENSLTSLVRHYRALDRWEDVANLYDRHLKLVVDVPRRIELLVARGRVLTEQVGSPERAMASYEAILEVDSEHSGALEALARLREQSGDSTAALGAIEALAAKASTPEAKADLWVRAAKLLEGRGDRDGAIERYKAALDADPKNVAATAALRAAYSARGDAASAVSLIEREIETAEGKLAKARLLGEMAKICRERLKDDSRAEAAAKKALELDVTALDALVVLGDLAFEAGRFHEAAKHFEALSARTDVLPKEDATRVLVRYVDTLAKINATEKAVASIETLLRLAPDDEAAIGRVAKVTFDHGEPNRAYELNKQYFEKFGSHLLGQERAATLYRLGEAARRVEKLGEAKALLQEAADIDPASTLPLDGLARLAESKGDWEEVVRIKTKKLDMGTADERSETLVEIGEVIAVKIGDRTRAAKSYVQALEDRPGDRRLLTKLMQLYSEEKDWAKLVEIVLRLADFVDDAKQKSKYVHTAAGIAHKQMQDLDAAIGYYDRVLALDPDFAVALNEAIELRREKKDWEGVEKLLQQKLEQAQNANDTARLLETFDAMAEVYHKHLGWTSEAIDAFEAAQTLDPDNRERNDQLASMYASDPSKYLEKAVVAQRAILRRNPHRPEAYKLLRKLYTEAKRADSAWCLCQALFVLNLAEPDEERFFKRMRSESAAPAQDRLTDEDWIKRVGHDDSDPLVTAIFALIEPAILQARAKPLEELGFDERYAIDLSLHPYPMSQTLYYAAGVLGMTPPLTFQNPNDPGGLSFLHGRTPAIVLGRAALAGDVPAQAAAYLAARHLANYRPGYYVRHLVPTGTGLRAWLFAAIKLIAPQFPVAPEMEGPVNENLEHLGRHFTGIEKEHLTSVVTKMLQGGGSLDLKSWVAGVDMTADRVGFLVAHDLETAAELIKATDDASASLPVRERLKELVLWSVSEDYFEVRQRLGITIDA